MARSQVSAGLLPVREVDGRLEFFLVHPGGPFFASKDDGSWSVAKGLVDPGEDRLAAAKRELSEETGFAPPEGPYVELGTVRQKSGKVVHAWAVAADLDPALLVSNEFELVWPPRSGRLQRFPEVDRAAWLDLEAAARKILEAQRPFLERAARARDAIFGREGAADQGSPSSSRQRSSSD